MIRALQDINLSLKKGDRLGIIGHNGAGKTTLLKAMAGVHPPARGTIKSTGKISPMFNTSLGMDPEDTGYENINNMGLFYGLDSSEIEKRLPEIEDFCELGSYLHLPVHTYSAGMVVRLTFAVATCVEPEILLLDEGLGAGDARFTERAKQRVDKLIEQSSLLVVASHSTSWINTLCNKALLLDQGKQILLGDVEEVLDLYEHFVKDTLDDAKFAGVQFFEDENETVQIDNAKSQNPTQEPTAQPSLQSIDKLKFEHAPLISNWDEARYLDLYPDVRDAVANEDFKSGLFHFLNYGCHQGRTLFQ